MRRNARDLYSAHAAPNTVPQGNLRSDMSLKTVARALQIVLAKRTVTRKLLPVKLNLEGYRSVDFRYDTSSAEEVLTRLQSVPVNREGMRWISKEDGALFYAVRHLELPYDEFVRRVDISRVGDCFRDVLGINTQVLHRNTAGRSILQVERIAALAQPNYAAFLGKDELDTYKLEWIEYSPDEERNWMRTVCSPNGSTLLDDGYMAFCRLPHGSGTKIEFVVNQSFPLPRLLVLFRVTRWAWLRNFLTKRAYRNFWRETEKNLLARYEGKAVWIGRPANKTVESRRHGSAPDRAATY